jgi:peptidoglycan/LPS O-acetylase OafA/YrhL
MNEKRLSYLEGLRGFAAIMVFLCHFGYAFYYSLFSANAAQANMPGNLDAVIAVSPFNMLYNGKLAVRIFFLLCGYVICIRYFQTKDKKYLVNAAIKRYFRLLVPILFIEIIIYLLMKSGAYHNGAAAVIAKSEDWFLLFNHSEPSFWEMIKEVFFDTFFGQAKTYLNVLWIIKYEFLGSLFVYAILYITGNWKYRDVLYVILILLCFRNNYVCIFIGMFLCDIMQNGVWWIDKLCKNKFILLLSFLIGMLFATYPAAGVYLQLEHKLDHTIYRFLGEPMVIIFYVIGSTLLFWVLLNSSLLQKFFDSKCLLFLGKYSFGIYLVHFPIIAAFSAWFLIKMNAGMDYNLLMVLNLILTALLVLISAVAFTKYIEPLGAKLASLVSNLIMSKMK